MYIPMYVCIYCKGATGLTGWNGGLLSLVKVGLIEVICTVEWHLGWMGQLIN